MKPFAWKWGILTIYVYHMFFHSGFKLKQNGRNLNKNKMVALALVTVTLFLRFENFHNLLQIK